MKYLLLTPFLFLSSCSPSKEAILKAIQDKEDIGYACSVVAKQLGMESRASYEEGQFSCNIYLTGIVVTGPSLTLDQKELATVIHFLYIQRLATKALK